MNCTVLNVERSKEFKGTFYSVRESNIEKDAFNIICSKDYPK